MAALYFVRDVLLATIGQMASLFAGIFIFGLLINFISRLTSNSLQRSFGRNGLYLMAWLGTPVHELGHALFCVLFFHKIEEIKFFEPDPASGTLGYVRHTYNKKNLWHILGNLFIGIGPIILGCIVLFALFYWLIPGSSRVWDSILVQSNGLNGNSLKSYFEVWQGSALASVKLIFTTENLSSWRFWVFLYLAICVASNISLSLSDVKHTFKGFGLVLLLFLLINLVSFMTGIANNKLFPLTVSSLGIVYNVLMLALSMALLSFIVIYLISVVNYRLRNHSVLNPF